MNKTKLTEEQLSIARTIGLNQAIKKVINEAKADGAKNIEIDNVLLMIMMSRTKRRGRKKGILL
jgi:uncharacterized protein YlxW (UPF0749 family)